jgi:hypothetical protein
MREISIPERVFLAVVCANAVFVAYLGILVPERMDRSFTWALVPPLHARFVGVSYLFGGVYLIACLLARHRSQVSPAFAAIGIFTGGLLLVTLLNLEAFDFDLVPVWVWTVSYVVYPVLGFGFAWASRNRDVPVEGPPLEPWARAFLQVQAAVFAVAGVGLLVVRETMVDLWPWPISNGLAQFYGGPFLAYAYVSWAYSRRRAWVEIAPVVPAMLCFTAGTLIVSSIHDELFSADDAATWVWFAGFGLATLALSAMAVRLVDVSWVRSRRSLSAA